MPRTKQRTPQLREHVLDVALALLARDGVGGFTARGLAAAAGTSTPAVYELFGDKAGLVREVFFAGFRLLHARLTALPESEDACADLVALCSAYRAFVRENPVLAQVMISRPFADFDPTAAEGEAGRGVRETIVIRVRRCAQEGVLHGEPADVAHVLVALVQGLALAEAGGRLGSSRAAIDRRWELAVRAMLDGLAPASVVRRRART